MNTYFSKHPTDADDRAVVAHRGIRAVRNPVPMVNERNRQASAAVARDLWAEQDPFLSMMNDRFGRNVFAPHPHRGFETLTYVLDGELQHRDSRGGLGCVASR